MLFRSYKGSAQLTTDLLGGHIDAAMAGITGLTPMVRSGKLRLLAISSLKRQPSFEGVPTIAETVPGYESGGWFGYVAPAGTPRDIVNGMQAQVVKAVAQPDLREKYIGMGSDPTTNTPQEFHALIKESVAMFQRIVKSAGIKPE